MARLRYIQSVYRDGSPQTRPGWFRGEEPLHLRCERAVLVQLAAVGQLRAHVPILQSTFSLTQPVPSCEISVLHSQQVGLVDAPESIVPKAALALADRPRCLA